MRKLSWNISTPVWRQQILPNIGYIDPNTREIEVPEPEAPITYTLTVYNSMGQSISKSYLLKPLGSR